jgi:hypothetical protein
MKSLRLIGAFAIAVGLTLSPMSAYAKHSGKKHAKHHHVKKHKAHAAAQAPAVAPAQ